MVLGGRCMPTASACVVVSDSVLSVKDSMAIADSLRMVAALDSMRGYTIYADTMQWAKDTLKSGKASLMQK